MPIGRGSLRTVGPRRAVVAAVASLALAASLLGYAPVRANDETVAATSAPVTSRADMHSAKVAAVSQNSPVEINNLGDQFTKVQANPDGTLTRTITPEPSRVQQADKSWAEIDTTLVSSGGQVVPTRAGAKVALSAGGSGPVASLEASRRFMSRAAAGLSGSPDLPGVDPAPAGPTVSAALVWPTDLPAPSLDGSVARYADVAAGVDLLVSALPTGFEVSIVLKTRPAGPVNIELPFTLDGLSMRTAPAGEGGGLQLVDSKNRIVGQGGSALAFDTTTGEDGLPEHRTAVPVAVSASGGSTVVTVSPPTGFLTDAQTVFPVTIDPAITLGPDKDTYVESDLPTTNFGTSNKLMVGKFTNGVARSYLRFPGTEMPGTVVNSAQLMLWNWASPTCVARTMMVYPAATGTWNPNKLTWNGNGPYTKPPALYNSPSAAVRSANGADGCPANWMGGSNGIDVTAIAQGWNSGMANYGIGLVAADETQYNASWQFRSSNWGGPYQTPRLILNYTTWPTVPTNLQVAQITPAGWVPTLTPTLTATPNSPDGGTCQVVFKVLATPTWSGVSSPGPCGQPQSVTVPAGVLAPTTTQPPYQWQAYSQVGSVQSPQYASGQAFRVDADVPGTVTITSDGTFDNAAWNTGATIGASTTFTFNHDPRDDNVVSYRVGFDGAATTTIAAAGADASAAWAWTITPGWHELSVQAVDSAGNVSAVVSRFAFGAGTAGFADLGIDDRSSSVFPVTANATAPATTADVQYLNPSTGAWASAPGGYATSAGASWSNNASGNTTTSGPTVSLSAVPVLWTPDPSTFSRPSIITIRVCFSNGSGTGNCTPARQLQWVAHAFGGNFATAPVGPGTLALATGELAVDATDATLPGTSIETGRTWLSLANTTGGIYGPGWAASLPAAASGAAASTPVFTAAEDLIALDHPDGSTDLYVAAGPPDPSGDQMFAGSGLTAMDGTSVILNQTTNLLTFNAPSGATTTWTVSGTSPNLVFTLQADAAPLLQGSTGYATHAPSSGADSRVYYTAGGRWMNSGTATNCSADPVGAIGRRGCRVMSVVLSPADTAGPSSAGPFANQVDHVDATAWDPAGSAMVTKTLAQYEYTSTGLLTAVWNPQLTPLSDGPLKTRYTYTGTGADLALATVTPPSTDGSLATWSFSWEPSVTGRLTQVDRPAPAGETATTSITYGLDLTGGEGLPAMDPATVAGWGQDFDDAPASAVAVFHPNPDHTTWSGSPVDPAEADWPYATLTYLNNLGAAVNTAAYGAGAWQIDTTEYDQFGQVTSTLSAGNRAAALPEPGPNCTLPPIVCATTGDSAARAQFLAAITVWDRDHPGVVTDTWTPVTAVPTDTIPTTSTSTGSRADASRAGRVETRTGGGHRSVVGGAPGTVGPGVGSVESPAKIRRCAKACKVARAKAAKLKVAKRKAARVAKRKAARARACRRHPHKCRTEPATIAPGLIPAAPGGPASGAVPGPVFTGPAPQSSLAPATGGVVDSGMSSVRVHTRSTYNEGLADQPEDVRRQFALDNTMLVTAATSALSVIGATGAGPDLDVHTTTTGYDPIVTGGVSGWVLRKPTSTTVAMNGAGPDLVSQTVYDQFGNPTESRPPSDSAGTTAATTNTVYFTADGSATVTACGNHPEWEGLVCRSGPAAQPTGGTSLPVSTTTGFDWFLNVLTGEERSPTGASLRSTTSSFDSAGRPTGSSITSKVAGDVPVPDSTLLYARNTGLPLSTTAGGESVSTGFDSWAQPTSYTDAAGNASSTTYDLAGRTATHSDGKGTYTYTYDTASEHRGLVTSMTAGVGGGLPDGFTFTYDAGGNPVNVGYPNGVTATMGFNPVGALTSKQYTDHAGVNILGWVLSRDGWGRIVEQAGPSAAGSRISGFGYDPAGRLTSVVDQNGAVCTGRGYGFDTGFNRLTRTTSSATAVSGVCPAGSTVSTTTGVFNTASQLLSTTVTGAGAATGSYVYDGLGRTTTVPAVDTNNPTGENLTLGFFSTDKPATQTIGGTVQSFGLDPVGRTDTTTTTTTSGSTSTASFFDSGSDSPAWSETNGTWTRFTGGPDGALALQITGTGTDPTSAELMLVNPHGDITATIPNTTNVPAAQISGINDTDEYGNVQNPPGPTPYGWEGAAQRSTADQAGIIQMGARQYNPTSGRFLTLDPVPGGNPNPYTYPLDPVNYEDLTGEFWGALFQVVKAVWRYIPTVVRWGYRAVSPVVSRVARSARSAVRSAARATVSAVNWAQRKVGQKMVNDPIWGDKSLLFGDKFSEGGRRGLLQGDKWALGWSGRSTPDKGAEQVFRFKYPALGGRKPQHWDLFIGPRR